MRNFFPAPATQFDRDMQAAGGDYTISLQCDVCGRVMLADTGYGYVQGHGPHPSCELFADGAIAASFVTNSERRSA